MGSKSRISKFIVPILQKEINNSGFNYWEPFCGGCNIIDKIKSNKRFASDNNEYLIEMWKHLLKYKNTDYPNIITYEDYANIRSDPNKYEKWYVGYVGFLASYNGRFFDGGYAKTIISKAGSIRNYYDEAKRNIFSQLNNLEDVVFNCCNYYNNNPKNLVIYCDPPYKNTKQYSTSKNFDHDKFWNTMRIWSKNNIVYISEEQAPEDFEIVWEQEILRTQDNKQRIKVTEKLFKYKIKKQI